MTAKLIGNQPKYTVLTLDNGLRMVHIASRSVAEIFGVAVGVGSRDEMPGEYGLAHFVEHTIFKGTPSRRASSIINRMETVGGELTAYTTKEETYVYSIFPTGNVTRAATLIADLVNNSVFPDNELDKEREVVAEEIDSYLDSPSEAVFDDFEDMIFAGSSLGHNILGNTTDLAGFNSQVCRRFLKKHYNARNMVAFYIGSESAAKVTSLIRRHFASLPGGQPSAQSADTAVAGVTATASVAAVGAVPRFDETKGDGSNHQGHTVMGARVPSLYSPQRHALALLNNILGGPGMNSRLNVALRERRGLVYSVESSLTLYTDCGLMTIYFGCNPEDTDRCKRLVETELRRLADTPVTEGILAKAKRQYIGQLIVSTASAEQLILSAARSLLFRDEVLTPRDIASLIASLTPDDLRLASSILSPSNFSALTLT